jgi:hypothetical protein
MDTQLHNRYQELQETVDSPERGIIESKRLHYQISRNQFRCFSLNENRSIKHIDV